MSQDIRADSDVLIRRAEEWAARIGVSPVEVSVVPLASSWGQCTSTGQVCLSEDLLSQPEEFIDQVIVHELLHLVVPNHGRLFKAMLAAFASTREELQDPIDLDRPPRGEPSPPCGGVRSATGM